MKPTPSHIRCAALAVAALASAAEAAPPPANQAPTRTNVVPLIVLENVPLADAIRNLARQAGLNIILDPRVPGSGSGQGSQTPQPSVRFRGTNQTAQAALSTLLREHKLTMVTNPATSVWRIVPSNLGVRPIPASPVGADTNDVIALVVLEDAPLAQAIRQFASQAHLNFLLDPRLAASDLVRETKVSVRWEKITARQALAALLDNYDLVLIEQPGTRSARITFKAEGQPNAIRTNHPDRNQSRSYDN